MDGGKKEKIRRIYAWVAIILFIALVINISTFQWELEISIGVYLFILIYYLFFLKKDKNVTTREYIHPKKEPVLDETDEDVKSTDPETEKKEK